MRAERLCFIGGSDQQRRNAQVRAYIYIPTVSKPAVVAALDGIEKIIHLTSDCYKFRERSLQYVYYSTAHLAY